jgi:long-chain acyl-CoA synthetase
MLNLDLDYNVFDLEAIITNTQLNTAVMADLNRLAIENRLTGLEKIKQVHLTVEPFTIESDVMTPTLKIRRNIAKIFFDKEIKELYARPLYA